MSEHFNNLTPAEHERLSLLAEEMGEAIQVIGKILRHGFDSNWEGKLPKTNRELLEQELGDVHYAKGLLCVSGDISNKAIQARAAEKALTVGQFLHHQEELELDLTKPHAFQFKKEVGSGSNAYKICKCGASEGNAIHV